MRLRQVGKAHLVEVQTILNPVGQESECFEVSFWTHFVYSLPDWPAVAVDESGFFSEGRLRLCESLFQEIVGNLQGRVSKRCELSGAG